MQVYKRKIVYIDSSYRKYIFLDILNYEILVAHVKAFLKFACNSCGKNNNTNIDLYIL